MLARREPLERRPGGQVVNQVEIEIEVVFEQQKHLGIMSRGAAQDAPDQFFMSETVAEMAAIAAELAATQPISTLTAAVFRDRLENGRKVAIQVLEFFDRAGVTVRIGDERRVRTDRLGMFGPAP